MRRCLSVAPYALLVLGALAVLYAAFDGDERDGDRCHRLGVVALIIGGTGVLHRREKLTSDELEAARQRGWDAGYEEGQSISPIVVTKLRSVPPPFGSSAEEFAEHLDV